jgi:hypothetical protein
LIVHILTPTTKVKKTLLRLIKRCTINDLKNY